MHLRQIMVVANGNVPTRMISATNHGPSFMGHASLLTMVCRDVNVMNYHKRLHVGTPRMAAAHSTLVNHVTFFSRVDANIVLTPIKTPTKPLKKKSSNIALGGLSVTSPVGHAMDGVKCKARMSKSRSTLLRPVVNATSEQCPHKTNL